MAVVHRQAMPFHWEGDRNVICLLLHGFTGSPSEMRVLGEYLREKGFGVACPLLPGHGTSPEEMYSTNWHDWYGAVEREFLRLQKDNPAKEVIPVGLSMGGLLALHLAFRQKPPGVVSLAAPFFVAQRKAYLSPLLQLIHDYEKKNLSSQEKEKRDAEGQFYYDRTPVRCVSSLLKLIRTVKREISQIRIPVLVIHSRDDRTADPRSAGYLVDKAGSSKKDILWLERSGHVITTGQERQEVFTAIEGFIEENCSLV